MQIEVTQIIIIVFSIFAISRAHLRFRERKLSSFAFIFWNFVWLGGILLIFFPEVTSRIAHLFGIGRGVDAVLYASIVVILYLIFRLYIKIEDTERQITQIARKIALKKVTRPRKTSR